MDPRMLMNPQFWNSPIGGAVTSFGFPMLARLFGAGRAQQDWYKELQRLQNGDGLNDEYNRQLQFLERASMGDRANILADSNAIQNSLQSAYARAGDSGLGATAATLGGSVAGNEFRRLNMNNRNQAYSMANQRLAQRFNQMAAMGPRPTPTLDAFAAGANDFQGFLNDYFQRRRNPMGSRGGGPPVTNFFGTTPRQGPYYGV